MEPPIAPKRFQETVAEAESWNFRVEHMEMWLAAGAHLFKMLIPMIDEQQTPGGKPKVHQWDRSFVFHLLSDPVRLKILFKLADGKSHTAAQLQAASGGKSANVLKHLVLLRTAGWAVMSENPSDGRRSLYTLSSTVPVTTREGDRMLDFGFCTVLVE